MLSFFKNFGKGILYVLVLPFLVVGLALYGVAAIFIFIFIAIKGLVLFFTGRSLYEDLPEDKEAKRRLAIQNGEIQESETSEEELKEPKEDIIEKQLHSDDDINKDPFYVPEYMKDQVQFEEEKTEETSSIEEETSIEEEPTKEEIEEIPQKSSQNTTILDINDEDEDDSDDSGVTIHFD